MYVAADCALLLALPLLPLQGQIERYERYSVPPEEDEEKEDKAVDATLGALRLLCSLAQCCACWDRFFKAAPLAVFRLQNGRTCRCSRVPHFCFVLYFPNSYCMPPSIEGALRLFSRPRLNLAPNPAPVSAPCPACPACSARLLQRPPAA